MKDPGDAEILREAFRERRVLVTLDKDFGELAVLRATPHIGIVRLVSIKAMDQAGICRSILEDTEFQREEVVARLDVEPDVRP